MSARLPGLLILALIAASCSRVRAPPDVVLVTIDRMRWEELEPWEGGVKAPALAALRARALELQGLVAPAPGGAPAALSVLTGEPPSVHGIRLAEENPVSPGVQSLADRLGARGWRCGAFLQTDQVTLFMRADRGFEAWDGPPLGFPAGVPAAQQSRDLEDTVARGLHWLQQIPRGTPGFLWLHLAEPALPDMEAGEREAAWTEFDRMLGAVLATSDRRSRERGVGTMLAICNLSSFRADPADAAREKFLLDASALRVRALVSAPDLPARALADLAGLDELAPLIEALATGRGSSRILDLVRGEGAMREAVFAETALPLTCCDAEPRRVLLREAGASRGPDDPAVAAKLAADTTWPGGRGAPRAEEVVGAYLALDDAWMNARRSGLAGAMDAFREAAEQGSPPGARVGLGLALVEAGRAQEGLAEFEALRATSKPGTLAWAQARLGIVHAARALGDAAAASAALDEMLAVNPGDLRALTRAAEIAEMSGDRQRVLGALRRLLEQDPDNPFALEELGRVLLGAGLARESADAFNQALARRPAHPQLLLESANALAFARDWWSAVERINEHVTLYGPSVEAHLLLARCWRDTGRDTAAMAEVRRARALAPSDPRPCAWLRTWTPSGTTEDAGAGALLGLAGCGQP